MTLDTIFENIEICVDFESINNSSNVKTKSSTCSIDIETLKVFNIKDFDNLFKQVSRTFSKPQSLYCVVNGIKCCVANGVGEHELDNGDVDFNEFINNVKKV